MAKCNRNTAAMHTAAMHVHIQIDAFHASTVGWGGNSRPLQPRNERSVVSYGRDGFYAVKSDFLDLYNQCTGLARTFDELLEA
mmetsp:Transcript_18116/g.26214  ORF Transcript_18116/g.26214 Transcript_18116/m.26214 type:complete len:83 (-) Transcript_18116:1322-1570(-)